MSIFKEAARMADEWVYDKEGRSKTMIAGNNMARLLRIIAALECGSVEPVTYISHGRNCDPTEQLNEGIGSLIGLDEAEDYYQECLTALYTQQQLEAAVLNDRDARVKAQTELEQYKAECVRLQSIIDAERIKAHDAAIEEAAKLFDNMAERSKSFTSSEINRIRADKIRALKGNHDQGNPLHPVRLEQASAEGLPAARDGVHRPVYLDPLVVPPPSTDVMCRTIWGTCHRGKFNPKEHVAYHLLADTPQHLKDRASEMLRAGGWR